jgi:predicted transcriptional regulator
MERLRRKGYLTRSKVDGVYRYSPSVPRLQLLNGLVRDFVDHALGGSVSPFVAYLAQDARITAEELEDLRRLVDELEQRSSDRP